MPTGASMPTGPPMPAGASVPAGAAIERAESAAPEHAVAYLLARIFGRHIKSLLERAYHIFGFDRNDDVFKLWLFEPEHACELDFQGLLNVFLDVLEVVLGDPQALERLHVSFCERSQPRGVHIFRG